MLVLIGISAPTVGGNLAFDLSKARHDRGERIELFSDLGHLLRAGV